MGEFKMCIENIVIISTVALTLATVAIAYFTMVNIKLTKEIKELQIRTAGSIIYASTNHGTEYSDNDFRIICDRMRVP